MHCHEFEERLQLLLDHRLIPGDDAQLLQHTQQCPECASLLRAEASLFRGLQHSRQQPVPAISAQVIARHQQTQRQQRTWRRFSWFAALSTLSVCGWLAFSWLPPKASPVDVVHQPVPTTTQHQPTEAELEEYRQTLESLASQISDKQRFEEVNASLQPTLRPLRSSFGLAIETLRRTLPRGKDERPARANDGAALPLDFPVTT